MKNYIKRALAGIIAFMVMFGNFAGIGFNVVKAGDVVAEEDDDGEYITYHIKVLDDKGLPVKDLNLQLNTVNTSGMGGEAAGTEHVENFEQSTDIEGKTYYKCNNNELPELAYNLKLKEGSGYILNGKVQIKFDQNFNDEHTFVSTVNNKSYDGTENTVYVKKDESTPPVIEDKFLEGKVVKNGTVITEKIMLQLERTNLSGESKKFGNYSAPRLGYIDFWSKRRK